MNDSTYYLATAAAQAVMGKDSGLKVDGIWGTKTEDTYRRADEATKANVASVVRALAKSTVEELKVFRDSQRSVGRAVIVTAGNDLKKLIQGYALEEGVPYETAMKIFKLESNFDPKARNRATGAAGLGQLMPIAIADIRQRAGYTVTDPYDVHQNIVGSLKYMKLVARDMGVSLTETAKVYMGYNIGPTGAKTVYAGQPEKVARLIAGQAYGPDPKSYQAKLETAVRAA